MSGYVGVADLFKFGIGPSSSHTMGPMLAARDFIGWARARAPGAKADRLSCELFGSLSATGKGHGTDLAILIGLRGRHPAEAGAEDVARARQDCVSGLAVALGGPAPLVVVPGRDIVFSRSKPLPRHPNALVFRLSQGDAVLAERRYYSVGGGFVESDDGPLDAVREGAAVPHDFASGAELIALTDATGLDIADLVLANERAIGGREPVEDLIDRVWAVMRQSVSAAFAEEGALPGPMQVRRRAAAMHDKLARAEAGNGRSDESEWLSLWAIATGETNAGFGRVVTAPTNGAAGIIPAVLHYYHRFLPGASPEGTRKFLLTATAFGSLLKRNASISGADVGCQGEVGSAAAMAAAGLAACLGGSPRQIENAAEIALEHHLGMTCDPIGGLVQIPCIERNALAASKAVSAARLALLGDGQHYVSFDQATLTMKETGRDMKRKYKETSRGGLAVNVPLC